MKRVLLLLAVLLLTVGTVSAANPTTHYKFDGDFTDSVGSEDGTNSGVSFAPGNLNRSAYFESSDSIEVKLSNLDLVGGDFTINYFGELKTRTADYDAILTKTDWNDGYLMYHNEAGTLGLRFYNTGTQCDVGTDVTTYHDGWHMYTWSYDYSDDMCYMYVDGEQVKSQSVTVKLGSCSNSLFIGSTMTDGSELDELKFYDAFLNGTEIGDLYNNSVYNSFVFSAYDEINETKLSISDVTVYNENQSVTGTAIDGDYYIYSNQLESLGSYVTSVDSSGYYSRNFIVENQNTPNYISTYLPSESETVIYDQFTLYNNVGLYDASDIILRLDKPMSGGTNTIYSSYFDTNSQASTYLIPNDAYILYIITPDETVNYGWLYPDADGSVAIILNAFEFEEVESWLDYTYECTDSAVSFDYTASKSVDTASFIVLYHNGTEAYNVSAATDTGSFTYNFPGNATYKINIGIVADDGNVFTMQKFKEIGTTDQRDFFPESFTLMLKSICVMFGVVIGVIALGSYRSDLAAMWAFSLYAFAVYQDWIYGNAITVSILGIIALAAVRKFQKRESRM